MNIRFEGKEIRQGNGFEYLGGMITGDGKLEADGQRRIQVGANGWKDLMADRKISR